MANTKISDLPGTTTLTDEDAIPVVQEGITKKFTGVLTALKTLLGIGDPETLQTQSKEVVGAVNELNGKTEEIETELSGITAIQDFSKSGVTVNASGVTEVQIDAAKPGYTPISAEAITIGHGNAVDKYFINSAGVLNMLIRNMESSQHTNDMSFRVRYIKNFASGS